MSSGKGIISCSDAEALAAEREFLAAYVPMLAAAAKRVCHSSADPEGWALMLLSLAAERVAYDARCAKGAAAYIELRAAVAKEAETFRTTIETYSVEGNAIVAAALIDLDAAKIA